MLKRPGPAGDVTTNKHHSRPNWRLQQQLLTSQPISFSAYVGARSAAGSTPSYLSRRVCARGSVHSAPPPPPPRGASRDIRVHATLVARDADALQGTAHELPRVPCAASVSAAVTTCTSHLLQTAAASRYKFDCPLSVRTVHGRPREARDILVVDHGPPLDRVWMAQDHAQADNPNVGPGDDANCEAALHNRCRTPTHHSPAMPPMPLPSTRPRRGLKPAGSRAPALRTHVDALGTGQSLGRHTPRGGATRWRRKRRKSTHGSRPPRAVRRSQPPGPLPRQRRRRAELRARSSRPFGLGSRERGCNRKFVVIIPQVPLPQVPLYCPQDRGCGHVVALLCFRKLARLCQALSWG